MSEDHPDQNRPAPEPSKLRAAIEEVYRRTGKPVDPELATASVDDLLGRLSDEELLRTARRFGYLESMGSDSIEFQLQVCLDGIKGVKINRV